MTEYTDKERQQINKALNIIREREPCLDRKTFTSTDIGKQFCRLRMAGKEREEFLVIYLDTQYRIIDDNIEFVGTINAAAVYPREIARQCLARGAAAVILCHNHPSGDSTPSHADKRITTDIKNALALFDISVLDHFIVGESVYGFAENGLI